MKIMQESFWYSSEEYEGPYSEEYEGPYWSDRDQ